MRSFSIIASSKTGCPPGRSNPRDSTSLEPPSGSISARPFHWRLRMARCHTSPLRRGGRARFKAHAWRACRLGRVSGVQIPPSPPGADVAATLIGRAATGLLGGCAYCLTRPISLPDIIKNSQLLSERGFDRIFLPDRNLGERCQYLDRLTVYALSIIAKIRGCELIRFSQAQINPAADYNTRARHRSVHPRLRL
jgi:hypothetical protein